MLNQVKGLLVNLLVLMTLKELDLIKTLKKTKKYIIYTHLTQSSKLNTAAN